MKHHNQILSLARSGNPVRAWERFGSSGLAEATGDIKALTLKGRLLKDLADRAAGDEKVRLYREAADAYLAANALRTDTYPLINAATLALLSQDTSKSAKLARQVLDLIESNPEEGETPYWREATRAEALLLLGEQAQAEGALKDGITKLPRAWEDHAATIGQFERILTAQGGDTAWLDAFRPAPSVHFSGLIGLDPDDPALAQAIEETITQLSPGFAYGALAAGADILLAERLVEAGALLHVVLPFDRATFRAVSVEPYGAQWLPRFDALMEQAESIAELWPEEGAQEHLHPMVHAANLATMGLSLRRAQSLRTEAHALAIKAVGEPRRPHLSIWKNNGGQVHCLETPRIANGTTGGVAQPVQLSAVLAVRGGDPAQLRAGQKLDVRSGDGSVEFSGSFDQCLELATHLQTAFPDASAGFVTSPVQTEDARQSAAALASRLALSAGEGQVYAGPNAAMVAKALDPARRIEELGEIGTLSGPLTVFSIA